jgi:hypothetical protein
MNDIKEKYFATCPTDGLQKEIDTCSIDRLAVIYRTKRLQIYRHRVRTYVGQGYSGKSNFHSAIYHIDQSQLSTVYESNKISIVVNN